MPQLSEQEALAILRDYCGVLYKRLVFQAARDDPPLLMQEWMSLMCEGLTDTDLANGLGYELRVAIDVVNMLCACRGFAPDRNHRFWRNAVADLWIAYGTDFENMPARGWWVSRLFEPPAHLMLQFDKLAFSCFSVAFEQWATSDLVGGMSELWRQVTWTDATSNCPRWILERREAATRTLQKYTSAPVRVLQLELCVPMTVRNLQGSICNGTITLEQHDWVKLSLVLPQLSNSNVNGSPGVATVGGLQLPTSHELSIALNPRHQHAFILHSNNLRGVRSLLCSSFVRCLTLDAFLYPESDRIDQVIGFGELLYSLLVEQKSLVKLRLGRHLTLESIATVCSLLPISPSLETLLMYGNSYHPNVPFHQWAWLAYGLLHPLRATMPSHRAANFTLSVERVTFRNMDDLKHLRDARGAIHPLQEMVEEMVASALMPDVLCASMCTWFKPGSGMAVVGPATSVFLDPRRRNRPVWTSSQTTELEAVVVVSILAVVGVVVRGFGLCWVLIDEATIRDTVRYDKDVSKSEPERLVRFGLRELLIGSAGTWQDFAGLTTCLDGKWLRSLSLTGAGYGGEPRAWLRLPNLELILKCCPNLETLNFETCYVRTLKHLVDAYESSSQPCRVSTLSVTGVCYRRGNTKKDFAPLLEMLADPTHPGSRVVRHLRLIGFASYHEPGAFETLDIAKLLASNLVLETVFIRADDYLHEIQPLEKWRDSSRRLLSPFQDQVLNDARSAWLGMLSVVRYCASFVDRNPDPSTVQRLKLRSRARLRRHLVLSALDEVLLRMILSFIGPHRVRTICWSCDLHASSFPELTNPFCHFQW